MYLFLIILATIVALSIFTFFIWKVATQSDTTSRVFNMVKEELARPSVVHCLKIQEFIMLDRCLSLVRDLFLTKV